ncbi:hypothetical protein NLG97_g4877 [Lecanicillium saksenae]|uniref:Uncharacterized protein n=1 Tax=Lecanicillium saksenae TaxID=468837 RepID=A0ACC1QV93_9HYPO|nr:hypothetical protein NLG97_g4877 [Lecanicillium saksenae]
MSSSAAPLNFFLTMAEWLIEYLALRHGDGLIKSNNTANSTYANDFSPTEGMPIRQPNFLPNPLIRQVRRRPAQLNLSKNIPTYGALPTPASSKPLSAMSVREKLLKGISMDINRLQASPASFDRVFPPKPAGIASSSKMKRAQETGDKLNKQLHAYETPDTADEEEEARQFEKKMRSAWVNTPMPSTPYTECSHITGENTASGCKSRFSFRPATSCRLRNSPKSAYFRRGCAAPAPRRRPEHLRPCLASCDAEAGQLAAGEIGTNILGQLTRNASVIIDIQSISYVRDVFISFDAIDVAGLPSTTTRWLGDEAAQTVCHYGPSSSGREIMQPYHRVVRVLARTTRETPKFGLDWPDTVFAHRGQLQHRQNCSDVVGGQTPTAPSCGLERRIELFYSHPLSLVSTRLGRRISADEDRRSGLAANGECIGLDTPYLTQPVTDDLGWRSRLARQHDLIRRLGNDTT